MEPSVEFRHYTNIVYFWCIDSELDPDRDGVYLEDLVWSLLKLDLT